MPGPHELQVPLFHTGRYPNVQKSLIVHRFEGWGRRMTVREAYVPNDFQNCRSCERKSRKDTISHTVLTCVISRVIKRWCLEYRCIRNDAQPRPATFCAYLIASLTSHMCVCVCVCVCVVCVCIRSSATWSFMQLYIIRHDVSLNYNVDR